MEPHLTQRMAVDQDQFPQYFITRFGVITRFGDLHLPAHLPVCLRLSIVLFEIQGLHRKPHSLNDLKVAK